MRTRWSSRRRTERAAAVLAWTAALLFVSVAASGQPAAEQEPPEKLVSLQFKSTEITDVLRQVGEATGEQFVFDSSLRGTITILAPNPMPVDAAIETLDAALLYKGLIAVPSPGGFRKVQRLLDIGANAPWLAEPLVGDSDRVAATLITLENTDPSAIASALREVMPSAVILPYPPTNGLILATSEARLRRLLYIASSFDAAQAQRLVVMPLRYRDPEEVIPLIEGAYNDPSRPDRALRVWPHPSGAHLIVEARHDTVDAVRGFVKRLDVPTAGLGRIHVVRVVNADAEAIAQRLSEAFAGEAGRDFAIAVDPHTGSLVIRSDPSTYWRVAELIAELDRPLPRILVEVTVFEVNTPKSKRLGFNALIPLSNPKDENDLIAFMTLLPDGIAPFLGSGGFPGIDDIPVLPPGIDLDDIDLSQIDLPPGVTPELLAGLDLDALRAAALAAASSTIARFSQAPLVIPIFDANGEQTDEIVIPLANAAAVARTTDIETRTYLNPRLLLLPGEEHEIFVGDNVPVPVSSAAAENPLSVSQNVERADIGITLRVRPTLSAEGPIQLELNVTTREVAPVTAAIDVDRIGPVFRNREVQSVIRLWPGEVAVIASRLEPIVEENVRGTPWLKDIPFFGYFFKSVTKRELNSFFIIAAQASLVPSEAERRAESLRRRVAMDQFDERMSGLRREAQTPYALRVAELVEQGDAEDIANDWSDAGYVARVVPWEALEGQRFDVYLTDFGDLRELGQTALELSGRSFRPEVVVLP